MADTGMTTAQILEWFRGELLHRGFDTDDARQLTQVACVEEIRQSGLSVAFPDQWTDPPAGSEPVEGTVVE